MQGIPSCVGLGQGFKVRVTGLRVRVRVTVLSLGFTNRAIIRVKVSLHGYYPQLLRHRQRYYRFRNFCCNFFFFCLGKSSCRGDVGSFRPLNEILVKAADNLESEFEVLRFYVYRDRM